MSGPSDFRRVMLVGRSKRDLLSYSGNQLRHPGVKDGDASVRWRVIFWHWVEPGKRSPRVFKSEVPNAMPHELAALACGEIEETALNVALPADMKTKDATRFLETEWQVRCMKRLGMIPEKRTHAGPILAGPEAHAIDQAHSRIVIATH